MPIEVENHPPFESDEPNRSAATFTNQEGNCAEIIIHCKVCGAALDDDSETCKACGSVFDVSSLNKTPPSLSNGINWKERLNKFKAMPAAKKVLIALGTLLAVGLAVFILYIIFSLIFSSVISLIAVAAGGYIVYHIWGAKYITQYRYNKKTKELQLPDGMSSKTLLEELSGKFNYPYFKGVRYGENGQCIIEGRYSVYPVLFNENNKAFLTCDLKVDEKKLRATMLEAIAIHSYINKFFNPSLPFDAVKDLKSLKSAEKQRKTAAIVLSVASILIIAVIVLEYALPGSMQRIMTPGIEVRDAYLSKYSETVTIEEAFENFFNNEKWSTYEAEGYSYVAFTGSCEFMGEKADTRIIFKITGEQFIVDSLDVNGRTQNDLILYSLLSAVYENY